MAGAPLQLASLAGYSPMVAGRFVGFGNLAFAIFGTAALLATAAVVSGRSPRVAGGRRRRAWAPGRGRRRMPRSSAATSVACWRWFRPSAPWACWRRVVACHGHVWSGSSPRCRGRRRIAGLDYLRPEEDRSHLGRFVDSLVDGDAATIVERKLEANVSLLTTSVLTLMVPLVLVFLAFLVRRPSGLLPWTFVRVPTLRAGLLAVLVLGVVGALVNDSGVAIPAMAATVAIPVAVAVVVRCMQLDDGRRRSAELDGEDPSGQPARARRHRGGAGRLIA